MTTPSFDKDPLWPFSGAAWAELPPLPPPTVTRRTFNDQLEDSLMNYGTEDLEEILRNELKLTPITEVPDGWTKRTLIRCFTGEMELPALVALGWRVVKEIAPDQALQRFLDAYAEAGGVAGPVKNLIFAADGPKPELVLADAVSNDIQITKNAKHCLVYDRAVPAEGLTYKGSRRLVA